MKDIITREWLAERWPESKGYDLDKMIRYATNHEAAAWAPSDCHRHEFEICPDDGKFQCVAYGGCGRGGQMSLRRGEPPEFYGDPWHWTKPPRPRSWWTRLLRL